MNCLKSLIRSMTILNLTRFLDTEIVRHNSAIVAKVYTTSGKVPVLGVVRFL